jgi:hypothetical protein
MNGIKEDNQSSCQTEIPERDRDDTFLLLLRSNPLDNESQGKHRLADKTKEEPEVKLKSRIFD